MGVRSDWERIFCSPWKIILLRIQPFLALFLLKLGMNLCTCFWEDVWLGKTSFGSLLLHLYFIIWIMILPALFGFENSFRVASWNLTFTRNISEGELVEFTSFLENGEVSLCYLVRVADSICWRLSILVEVAFCVLICNEVIKRGWLSMNMQPLSQLSRIFYLLSCWASTVALLKLY